MFEKSSLSLMGYGKINEIKTGDFNADGKIDLMMPNLKNIPSIYLSEGTRFRYATKIRTSHKSSGELKIADFNADGLPDIYEVDEGSDIIYFNQGNMGFKKANMFPLLLHIMS